MAEPQRGSAFHFHPNCMLSSHINSRITSQTFIRILTFKIFLPGVYMFLSSLVVTFDIIFNSIIFHFVTFAGLDLALFGI